jgi:predicted dehydrogenase
MRLLAAAASDGANHGLPTIVSAQPLLKSKVPAIDRAMKIELAWDNGTVGRIHHSLMSSSFLKMSARVVGEHGTLDVLNPYLPHVFHRLKSTIRGQTRREHLKGDTTYTYQLREFVRRIQLGAPWASDLSDSIGNMQMIDAIYDRAGMPRRGLPA